MTVNIVNTLKYLRNYLCVDLKARSSAKFDYDDEYGKGGYKIVCFAPFQFDFVCINKNKNNYTAVFHTNNNTVYSFDFDGTIEEAQKNMNNNFRRYEK